MGFHSFPRFGRSDQFSDLLSTNADEAVDYAVGICIMAIIIATFFLGYGILLLAFKCCCGGVLGFLGGAPYKSQRTAQGGRIIFGVSGILFIIFTLTLIFLGYGNLESTTDELSEGVDVVNRIFEDAGSRLTQFLGFVDQALVRKNAAVAKLEDVFELTADGVATLADKLNDTSLPFELANGTVVEAVGDKLEAVGDQIGDAVDEAKYTFNNINLRDKAEEILALLNQIDDFIQEPAGELDSVVRKGQNLTSNVSDGLSDVKLRRLQIGFGVPFTIVPFVMLVLMGMVAMGHGGPTMNTITSYVMLPILSILTAFLVILTLGFAIGGIVNGDFCSGGQEKTPEETLTQIMIARQIEPTRLQYQMAEYMIYGCDITTPNPMDEFTNFEERIEKATTQLKDFDVTIQEIGIENIARRLNKNMDDFEGIMESLRERSKDMGGLLLKVLDGLACLTIYAIYNEVVNDATCDKSLKGLTWAFASLLIMSLSGMMMLTFRSVLYPVEEEEEPQADFEIKEVKPVVNDNEIDGEGAGGGYAVQTGLAPIEKPDPNTESAEKPKDYGDDSGDWLKE